MVFPIKNTRSFSALCALFLSISLASSVKATITAGEHLQEKIDKNTNFDLFILHDTHLTKNKKVMEYQNDQLKISLEEHPESKLIIEARCNALESPEGLYENGAMHKDWPDQVKETFKKTFGVICESIKSNHCSGLACFYDPAKHINVDTHRHIRDTGWDEPLRPETQDLLNTMTVHDLMLLMEKQQQIAQDLIKNNEICKKYREFIKADDKSNSELLIFDKFIKAFSDTPETKNYLLKRWVEDMNKLKEDVKYNKIDLSSFYPIIPSYKTFLDFLLELKTLKEIEDLKNNDQKQVIVWLGGAHCKRMSTFLQQQKFNLVKKIESISDNDFGQYVEIFKNNFQQMPWIDLTQILPTTKTTQINPGTSPTLQELATSLQKFKAEELKRKNGISMWPYVCAAAGVCLAYYYRDTIKSCLYSLLPAYITKWFGAQPST